MALLDAASLALALDEADTLAEAFQRHMSRRTQHIRLYHQR